MRILLQIFFFFILSFIVHCNFFYSLNSFTKLIASIIEGYKLNSWKEENLTKIDFSIKKYTSDSFSIIIDIPSLWNDNEIGISIYLVDK